ncbi:MAG: DNA polymerase III subunit delta [Marinosulfonomonas sp.]|nr:DNA polymerase III subunit delta [Marinosulfonomonas sp.]
MKLSPRDAGGYFARPDAGRTGILIYGVDAMRVALKRQQLIASLIGPEGEEEMRLSRIPASDLRKDPAALDAAVKSQGFFPGARVAFVEGATEATAKTLTAALADWQPGDAQIVVTAGSLNARSGLRKLFEAHKNAYAVGIYDDPPSRQEIEAELSKAGLSNIDSAAMQDIHGLARMLDPGDFRQTIEKLSLFKLGDATPVSSQDILACSPATIEAALDDVLNCVAEAKEDQIGPIMRTLGAQGIQAVGLCIGATRHFRVLHAAASDPAGAAAGIGRVRPPVFGPRRDRMSRQAQDWGLRKLEVALQMLTETDLTLRSTSRAPQMAVIERTLIRLAMLGKR